MGGGRWKVTQKSQFLAPTGTQERLMFNLSVVPLVQLCLELSIFVNHGSELSLSFVLWPSGPDLGPDQDLTWTWTWPGTWPWTWAWQFFAKVWHGQLYYGFLDCNWNYLSFHIKLLLFVKTLFISTSTLWKQIKIRDCLFKVQQSALPVLAGVISFTIHGCRW